MKKDRRITASPEEPTINPTSLMTTPTVRLTGFLTSIITEFCSDLSSSYDPMDLFHLRGQVEELQQALEGWIPAMYSHQLAMILEEIDAHECADEEVA